MYRQHGATRKHQGITRQFMSGVKAVFWYALICIMPRNEIDCIPSSCGDGGSKPDVGFAQPVTTGGAIAPRRAGMSLMNPFNRRRNDRAYPPMATMAVPSAVRDGGAAPYNAANAAMPLGVPARASNAAANLPLSRTSRPHSQPSISAMALQEDTRLHRTGPDRNFGGKGTINTAHAPNSVSTMPPTATPASTPSRHPQIPQPVAGRSANKAVRTAPAVSAAPPYISSSIPEQQPVTTKAAAMRVKASGISNAYGPSLRVPAHSAVSRPNAGLVRPASTLKHVGGENTGPTTSAAVSSTGGSGHLPIDVHPAYAHASLGGVGTNHDTTRTASVGPPYIPRTHSPPQLSSREKRDSGVFV